MTFDELFHKSPIRDFYEFIQRANRAGFFPKKVDGTFSIDKPNITARNFTPQELMSMRNLELSMHEYAEKFGIMEELRKISHTWIEHEGKIYDGRAHDLFIKTNLASDTSPARYSK
jgi:hypothetical protein